MKNLQTHGKWQRALAILIFLFAGASAAEAQQASGDQKPDAPTPASQSSPPSQAQAPSTIKIDAGSSTHRFWDRTNDWWFAGVGASRAFDYASTLNIRRRGINEVFLTNSIVDNHPLFAGIEAAATGASIGASYIFHRTGHHRLERWTSIVHFSVATVGAVRNYCLKTPHPS